MLVLRELSKDFGGLEISLAKVHEEITDIKVCIVVVSEIPFADDIFC